MKIIPFIHKVIFTFIRNENTNETNIFKNKKFYRPK